MVEPVRPLPERRAVTLVTAFVRHVGPMRLVGAVAACVVVVIVGAWLFRPAPPPVEASLPFAAPIADALTEPVSGTVVATVVGTVVPTPSSTTLPPIVVHVAGAVARPGLVRIEAGSRVADAIVAAGGPAPGAAADALNLAQVLVDGARVQVPLEGEAVQPVFAPPGARGDGTSRTDAEGRAPGPVDLNTASARELETLPGVGPATAAAIIDHRERNGQFRRVDDLLEVSGIGPAKFEALRDLVTV
jgi:competence protein ComEA